jgi:large subunit ribosomal protein L4
MKLSVLNKEGKDTGRVVELDAEIFGITPNDHAIYLDVKQYLANNRQGTHKAKNRNEVAYSTRKLKKQKGTGGARAGSLRSGTIVGGGRMFGPVPRDYSFKLNKKVKEIARLSALAYKAKNEAIMVVEDFDMDSPKTKTIVALKNNLKLSDKKSVLVLPESNKNIYLSSRNLPGSKVVSVYDLNTYDIMNAGTIVFFESTVGKIQDNG